MVVGIEVVRHHDALAGASDALGEKGEQDVLDLDVAAGQLVEVTG